MKKKDLQYSTFGKQCYCPKLFFLPAWAGTSFLLAWSAEPPHVKTLYVSVSPGGWSIWGQWAQCSSECGGGIQTRTRTCQSPPEESYLCEGVVEEGRPCNPQSCRGELLIRVCFVFILPYVHYLFFFFTFFCLNISVWCVPKCVCSHYITFLTPYFFCLCVCVCVWLHVCPSFVSPCFASRCACWNGDFDRCKITMVWWNIFKAMHGHSMSEGHCGEDR